MELSKELGRTEQKLFCNHENDECKERQSIFIRRFIYAQLDLMHEMSNHGFSKEEIREDFIKTLENHLKDFE